VRIPHNAGDRFIPNRTASALVPVKVQSETPSSKCLGDLRVRVLAMFDLFALGEIPSRARASKTTVRIPHNAGDRFIPNRTASEGLACLAGTSPARNLAAGVLF
jgi:hypothetical protein